MVFPPNQKEKKILHWDHLELLYKYLFGVYSVFNPFTLLLLLLFSPKKSRRGRGSTESPRIST